MDIERIDENIIRIIITQQDLEDRNVDFNDLNYESPETQELFWDMMEQAEDEFGFCVADSQLIVEPIPDTKNGFIVTITKIGEDVDLDSIQKFLKNKGKKSDIRKRELTKYVTNVLVFVFESLDDIVALSERIHEHFSGESKVYKYSGEYYLVLKGDKENMKKAMKIIMVICEYGNSVSNSSFFEGVLCEYGEILIEENSLNVLKRYFS